AYGTFTGWSSPAIVALQSENPPVGDQPITNDEAMWIGSLLFLGYLCGSPLYSYIAELFGRKPACLLLAVPALINCILIILGDTLIYIYVARFLAGLSIGGTLTIIPIYVGETCDINIRGALGTYFTILGNLGIVLSYAVGSFVSYRTFAYTLLCFPTLFFVLFIFMPETPIYLLRKGDWEKAKYSFKFLKGNYNEIDDELMKIYNILKEEEQRKSEIGVIKSLLFEKGSRRALIIGLVISAVIILDGTYVILSYNATIFEMSGSQIPSNISSIINGQENGSDLSSLGFIPLICLVIYVGMTGCIGGILMVYMSELFLPPLRSTSASICVFVKSFLAFITTRFYNDLNSVIGNYGSFWFFAAICVFANIITLAYGTFTGWSSPAIVALQSENPPVGDQPIDNDQAMWIGSLLFLGYLCGSPLYSYIAEKFGRKPACLLLAVPALINCILIILGDTLIYIYVARFLAGLSIGGTHTTIPIYVGETCDVNIRGALGTYFAILCNLGIVLSYAVGSFVPYRTFAYILLFCPALFFVLFIFMPETPIYLLRKGNLEKAKYSFKFLNGNYSEIDEDLMKLYVVLKEEEQRKSEIGVMKSLLFEKGSRRALIIGLVISAVIILDGTYVILSYNATIFEMSGSQIPSNISSIINGSMSVLASSFSSFVVDRVGRKLLLIVSLTAMGTSLFILGVYFYLLETGSDLSSLGFIPLICLMIYVIGMAGGIGGVLMVYMSELFLPPLRSTSASICVFTKAFLAFITTKFYNDLNSVIGMYGSFWFFAVVCVFGALFTFFYIPETKNISVECIHAELRGEKRTSK
ncbi:hypothetical protein C0J52_19711, partial [Blattella germanica]